MSWNIRHSLGLAALALLSVTASSAQSFTGPTYINFETAGSDEYDLSFYADTVVGGSEYGSAWASFGSFYGSSWSYYGEAGVTMQFNGVRKVGGQWYADSVWIWEFNNSGVYDTRVQYGPSVPASGWVDGNATVGAYSQTVRGTLSGY
jgi:hypothetical protein